MTDTLEAPSPNGHVDLSQWKIPPRKVPSDDCKIVIGRQIKDGEIVAPGTEYFPHVGESVWILPTGTLQTYLEVAKFEKLALAGDSPEVLDQNLDALCAKLASVVVGWDWTDIRRQPLAPPYQNPAVLKTLEVEELYWLLGATQGEVSSERKNGSDPSPSTSKTPRSTARLMK